tara:strand:- start:7966 stop:8823 length:858 start_codon:yes stop_codon:yes gene_type:complete
MGNFFQDAWNAVTGQVTEDEIQTVDWENQTWNPDWNTTFQNATAQGYTGEGYDATQAGFQTGEQFKNILEQALTQSGQFFDQSQQFLDPSSGFYRNAQGQLVRAGGQMAGQQSAQQSAELAARGIGGGGLRSLLGGQNYTSAMDTIGGNMTNMYMQGAGIGTGLANVGSGLLGQAGTMSTSQEANILQTALANQQATNQASAFTADATNVANQFTANARNQMAQFNAQQNLQNQQFNASNQMNFTTWNAAQDFAADQFNASQHNAATMANAENEANFWQSWIPGS